MMYFSYSYAFINLMEKPLHLIERTKRRGHGMLLWNALDGQGTT